MNRSSVTFGSRYKTVFPLVGGGVRKRVCSRKKRAKIKILIRIGLELLPQFFGNYVSIFMEIIVKRM